MRHESYTKEFTDYEIEVDGLQYRWSGDAEITEYIEGDGYTTPITSSKEVVITYTYKMELYDELRDRWLEIKPEIGVICAIEEEIYYNE